MYHDIHVNGWWLDTHFILLCTSCKKSFKQEVVLLEMKMCYCFDHLQNQLNKHNPRLY